MDYKNLGRTGVKVSPLCLGAMNFGWGADEAESERMVDRALEAGINFIDTADVYAKGESERITGRLLRGKRNRVVLATKVHGKMGDGPNDWGNTRRHIIEGCEASLRRLDTDYIDLYQLHRPQSDVPVDESLRALDDLVRAGKVRYLGTSTFGAWQLVEGVWMSEKLGLNRWVCEQPPYNLLDRRVERELFPMAQSYGFGIIPWSPLAGGMLTGKYRRNEAGPEGSRYESGKFRSGEPVPEGAWDVIEGIAQIAQDKNVAMDAFALAWCNAHPAVTSPIIGPRTLEQLEGNLKALEIEITEDDKKRVDELIPPGTHVAPYYEADFGPHTSR